MGSSECLGSAILSLILSCVWLGGPCSCSARTDSIKLGEGLPFSENLLVSAQGTFTLGFFSLDTGTYLGIWYTSDVNNKKVWVANRDKPISGTNANLMLDELNTDGSVKQTLWESFDDPTDTLLPGMKLGINLKTRMEWHTTGNETPRDIYWSSGILKDLGFEFISSVRFATHHSIYYFISVCNDNEIYFSYSVQDGAISKWVLNSRGGFFDTHGTLFVKEDMCDRYDKYPGCAVQEPPTCRTRDYQFMKQSVLNSGYPSLMNIDTSLGLSDCQAICRNNCSCTACNTVFTNGTGCQFWRDELPRAQVGDANQEELYVLSSSEDKGKPWWIWVIIFVVVVFLFMLPVFCCSQRNSRGDGKMGETSCKRRKSSTANALSDSKDIDKVKQFSLVSVMAATNNFSDENKIGKGGFGPVYKGKLSTGQEIAVKRLSRDSEQGSAQFYNERLIAKQQHRNLVRLLGYCIEGEEKMLIYEFMPNRSLEDVLFAPAGRKGLDWNTRCNIIEGIAQGLDYLHKHSRLNMVHRDLKASNILLDHDMNPKISDFGTARIFEPNASEVKTNNIVGTPGFMPPEYAMWGVYSRKTDVYSFGVLLLEIVSREMNIPCGSKNGAGNLINHAWKLWGEGNSLELVDPAVRDPHSRTQMLRCIHVALLCVQNSAEERPTMSQVCSILTNKTEGLPNPNPPPLCT
ncbi:G-type lectin S-receptor-like serine/threonine-protein kinase At1g61420 [Vitis riparia]|uniref:G-type lectin S-receptor-like serine/threonine-protein kinase At1g61420 n=1 Tax=Vitis riparia TaxID=96939 RepID=UPI00155AEBA7|nr:G-type lectin S-receptor-like serine/threonine-protein kinase At1g61420 [Vitis riparia]